MLVQVARVADYAWQELWCSQCTTGIDDMMMLSLVQVLGGFRVVLVLFASCRAAVVAAAAASQFPSTRSLEQSRSWWRNLWQCKAMIALLHLIEHRQARLMI
jgi:hypothetical protein